MHAVVVTPPAAVISWDDAKAHLRIDSTDDQAYVEGLAAAALAWIGGPQGWLGRAVGQQTLQARAESFGCDRFLRLPCGPVTSITSIKYLDPEGVEQTIDPSTYSLLSDGAIALAAAARWPSIASDPEAVRIVYVAGEQPVPAAIKQAMLLLIGQWYQTREAVSIANTVNAMPFAVEALLSTYRIYR